MSGFGFPELVIVAGLLFFGLLLTVLPFWRIFRKAGFSSWWSVLMLVPGANLVALFYLAFAEWPSLRRSNDPGSALRQ